MKNFLRSFQNNKRLVSQLANSVVGLELEVNRVQKNGRLSNRAYPIEFGNRRENNFIMSDYTEGMFEIATPPMNTFKSAYEELIRLSNFIRSPLEEDESLWPYSMPPHIPTKDITWLENYFERYWVKDYHDYLNNKYGPVRGIISGPHINFSINDELLSRLYEESNYTDLTDFTNNFYYELAKSIEANRWLFIYLFGCSPVSFNFESAGVPNDIGPVRSLRTSKYGYVNKENESIGYYGTFNEHIDNVAKAIKKADLYGASEFYGSVRFKGAANLADLKVNGVKYIEIRIIDANIFSPYGLSCEDLEMFELLLYWMIIFSKNYESNILKYFSDLGDEVALQHPLRHIKDVNLIDEIIQELKITNAIFDYRYSKTLDRVVLLLQRPPLTPAAKLLKQADNEEDLYAWITDRANQYQKDYRKQTLEYGNLS